MVLFAPGASVYAFRPNEGTIKQPGEVEFDGLITIHKVFDARGTKYKAISDELFALRRRLLWNASLTVTWESENENVQLRGTARLTIAGWNAKSIAYARREINRIMEGYPVIYDSRPVWHDFFLTEDGLAYLKGTGSQHNVHVHRSPSKHMLYLFGSTGGRAICKATFLDMVEKLTVGTLEIGPKFEVDDKCPVCLDKAVNSFQFHCGHVYCKDCFAHRCATVQDKDLPLWCETCNSVFLLAEMQRALTYDEFEDLLARSLKIFINAEFKTYRNCPTPYCQQVYKISDGVLTCPTCFEDICMQCNVPYHEGETCTAFQERIEEGHAVFAKWKAENNAKDCPRCGIIIQKAGGCNLVQCGRCTANICWVCLEVFTMGDEVYDHMLSAHGGIVDDDAELDDDEMWFDEH